MRIKLNLMVIVVRRFDRVLELNRSPVKKKEELGLMDREGNNKETFEFNKRRVGRLVCNGV